MNEEKKQLPKHFETIEELPMWNWNKIMETQNMVHLLIKPKKITEKETVYLYKIWQTIYEEYIISFGFPDEMMRIHEKNKAIARLQAKMLLTDDNSILNLITRKRKEIEAMSKNRPKADIYRTKMAVEKFLGFHVNLKTISVKEFYTYHKEMEKRNTSSN